MKTTQIIYLMCFISIPVFAQDPGDLNMAFGHDGVFSAIWNDTLSAASDIGVLSDGSLVVAGKFSCQSTTSPGAAEFLVNVLKLNDQGEILPFGNTLRGFAYHLPDSRIQVNVEKLCVLPDDKIVVVIRSMLPLEAAHLIMLNAEGEPEITFGEGGEYTGTRTMFVYDIDFFQQDEEYFMVMCGKNEDGQPVLLMIDHEGEPVASFGTSGMYTLYSRSGSFTNLVIDRETNQMYVQGYSSGSAFDCATFLAKYELPEGHRSTQFGVDGIKCFSVASGFYGNTNDLVYEGSSHTLTAFGFHPHPDGDYDIFAFRVNADEGTADPEFGMNGLSTLRVPVSDDVISSAFAQSDGKYYFGGYTNINGNYDFLAGRLNADGILDNSFGSFGLVTTEIYFRKDNQAFSIALSPDCNILYAAGSTNTPDDQSIAVAAYHTGYEPATGLGIDEQVSGPVKISPNPVLDQVRIQTGQTGFLQVRIIDVTGKEVFHQNHRGDCAVLNLGFLPAALYFVQITLPDKQVGTYKLLKQ